MLRSVRSWSRNRIAARGRLDQLEDGAGDRGLAAARFADQRQRLALRDRERDVVHGVHDVDRLLAEAAADVEVDREIVDLQEGSRRRLAARRHPAWPVAQKQETQWRSPDLHRLRLGGRTDVEHVLAARMEPAARGRGDEIGDRARDGLQLRGRAAVRQALVERDRVRVAGPAEHVHHRPLLDDAPGVHHGDAVAGLRGHADVVRDDHLGDAQLLAQPEQQVEDLRLDGHVERGGRFVGDEQRRAAGQRHRHADPLSHAAAELMRVALECLVGGRKADLGQRPARGLPRLLACDTPLWMRTTSSIWWPTWKTGLSEASGSWNTIEISRPRSSCISLSLLASRSSPR